MTNPRKASARTKAVLSVEPADLAGGLAGALEGELASEHFKQFLDQMPFAVGVSQLKPAEHIIYVNLEFARLTGRGSIDMAGKPWKALAGEASADDDDRKLGRAVTTEQDYIGTFDLKTGDIAADDTKITVDVWSNLIQDDEGTATFRLIALADAGLRNGAERAALEQAVTDKDVLLSELQHRVKNNLQMITALIRLEARNIPVDASDTRFDRLAGRVEALGLLYRSLSHEGATDTIDLGTYLSEIAAAVMRAHAVEGIHFELKVDSWPVTINVAMPTGLVVNELLTNALKHAFPAGREGTIALHCLVDKRGCEIIVADDGIGLPADSGWPKPGKLGAMIVQSLRQNARAQVDVTSRQGKGTRARILFARVDGEAKV